MALHVCQFSAVALTELQLPEMFYFSVFNVVFVHHLDFWQYPDLSVMNERLVRTLRAETEPS